MAFEIPAATFIVDWVGLADVATLRRSRPYVIVRCFVVGRMILTLPDRCSQTLPAVPIRVLFAFGRLTAPRANARGQLIKPHKADDPLVAFLNALLAGNYASWFFILIR
ncbi:hypothetical protein KMS_R09960 [Pseudomonas sp. LRP2-20]|nr:hypothetical protein KMS_R09960 [Pseudomonas sp. LRP2-20]